MKLRATPMAPKFPHDFGTPQKKYHLVEQEDWEKTTNAGEEDLPLKTVECSSSFMFPKTSAIRKVLGKPIGLHIPTIHSPTILKHLPFAGDFPGAIASRRQMLWMVIPKENGEELGCFETPQRPRLHESHVQSTTICPLMAH